MRILSVVFAVVWLVGWCGADEKRAEVYEQVKVERGVFAGDGLVMLDQEKRSMATQLAAYVVNELGEKVGKRDLRATRLAERMVALALNLDPRNRTAVIANGQMGRGVVPGKVEAEYSAEVLSQLLVTRAKLLKEQDGGANVVLAGFLFEVAVEIDPRNEDAIYELEMFRLDEEAVDWRLLTVGEKVG